MQNLLLNLILAIIWLFLLGNFSVPGFMVGFVLGYFVLRLSEPVLGQAGYDDRMWQQIKLVILFFYDLFMSILSVAWEVLTPGHGMRAGIVGVPLDVSSDFGITAFANHISLTPGTLTLDISDDRSMLFIHAMYVDDDLDIERAALKTTTEQRVIDALGSAAYDTSATKEVSPEPVT